MWRHLAQTAAHHKDVFVSGGVGVIATIAGWFSAAMPILQGLAFIMAILASCYAIALSRKRMKNDKKR